MVHLTCLAAPAAHGAVPDAAPAVAPVAEFAVTAWAPDTPAAAPALAADATVDEDVWLVAVALSLAAAGAAHAIFSIRTIECAQVIHRVHTAQITF